MYCEVTERRDESGHARPARDQGHVKPTHHVVALTRLVALVVVADGVKRTATRVKNAAVGALDRLLKGALGLRDRIRERKDDRALVVRRHKVEDCRVSKRVS